jgi:virginiamycin B lyase
MNACSPGGSSASSALKPSPYRGEKSKSPPITVDRENNIWFVESGSGNVVEFDPKLNAVSRHHIPLSRSNPVEIAAAQDGSIWFTELRGNVIGKFNPVNGKFDLRQLEPRANPKGLTIDDSGRIWFVERGTGKVGYIADAGELCTFPLSDTWGSEPTGIAKGTNNEL